MEKTSTSTRSLSVLQMALIGVMTAITCILGPLSIHIPGTPVPISFTNLAIYITLYVLGMKAGTISYLIYLLLGVVGLPIFSGFTGGPADDDGVRAGQKLAFQQPPQRGQIYASVGRKGRNDCGSGACKDWQLHNKILLFHNANGRRVPPGSGRKEKNVHPAIRRGARFFRIADEYYL